MKKILISNELDEFYSSENPLKKKDNNENNLKIVNSDEIIKINNEEFENLEEVDELEELEELEEVDEFDDEFDKFDKYLFALLQYFGTLFIYCLESNYFFFINFSSEND